MRSSKAELKADFDRIITSAKNKRIIYRKLGENRISFYSPLPPHEVKYGPLEEAFLHAKREYHITVEIAGGGYGCLKIDLNAELENGNSGEQLDLFLRDKHTQACLDKAGVTYASFVSKHLSGHFEGFSDFVFYYGTNRARRTAADLREFYGEDDVKRLETGLAHVHVSGVPPKTNWIRRIWNKIKPKKFRDIGKQYAVIAEIEPLPEKDTWQRFSKDAESLQPLFFIHGFNISFAESFQNFGLFLNKLGAYQTSPSILPVFYAWPGSPNVGWKKYLAADNLGRSTVPHTRRMLEQLIQHAQNSPPNLMAHSHGAQVLVSTLESKRESWGLTGNVFKELVLIAPDVDSAGYELAHDEIEKMVHRISIYYNEKDLPLWVSSWLRAHSPRLGKNPSGLVARGTDLDLIDTVHVSKGKKHSYHMDANEVIYDLNKLLSGDPALERGAWIRPKDGNNPNNRNWMLIRPGDS